MENFKKNITPIKNFLCSAIAFNHDKNIRELYESLDDKIIWEEASKNLVEPIVGYRLIEEFGENNIPNHWVKSYKDTHNRTSSYLVELDRISEVLSSEGIKLVALKNGGIAKAIYPIPGCVPMGDLDILVRRSDFRQAHKVLSENGYTISAPNLLEKADVDYGYRTGGSEYTTTLPDGRPLWLELQWRPIAGRWIRPEQEPTADELIERSVDVPGTSVRTLCPEDNLLQVALHTAKHSYVRAPGFRLHLDVDRIVNGQHIDWDVFLKRVLSLHIKTPVFFSLIIPKLLFGTPIPDEIIKNIKPSYLKEKLISYWLHTVGLYNPHEPKFGKIGYILFCGLLYDNVQTLLKSVFPNSDRIKDTYGITNGYLLPYYYCKRILDLMIKRMPT